MSEDRPEVGDVERASEREKGRDQMSPGDEVPPGDPSAGENLCRECGGSGEIDGSPCANCGGTGRTTSAVSSGP
jgi:DnaJ-class molecular chaperone